jgi:CheY-like chemotaxis protein
MSQSGLNSLRPDGAAHEAAGDVRPSPPRLLLVEDEGAIRESLGQALQEDGFEVMAAANGREALDILRNSPRPSAILLDLTMPIMDGWDFRNEQLNDPSLRDIPVLVVSASGFSPETIRIQFGDVELIRKPVLYPTLLETLGRVCRPTASVACPTADEDGRRRAELE